jgi:hypothetical protein
VLCVVVVPVLDCTIGAEGGAGCRPRLDVCMRRRYGYTCCARMETPWLLGVVCSHAFWGGDVRDCRGVHVR